MSRINDKEQKFVIHDITHNIIMKARAGCGKTNTLAERTAYLITSGAAKAEEILCLTFTNKACQELKDRIKQLCMEKGVDGDAVTVSTFHAFCAYVIKQEAKQSTDVSFNYEILDEEDGQAILQELPFKPLKDDRVQSINGYAKMLWAFLSKVKETYGLGWYKKENQSYSYPEAVKSVLNNQAVFNDITRKNYTVQRFLRENGLKMIHAYNMQMAKLHALDFTDLMIRVVELFKDPTIADVWHRRYKYFNVDEVQDTSFLEYLVLFTLFQGNKVLLAGDLEQSIYGWRGAKPLAVQEDFKENFPDVQEIELKHNYRSTQAILNVSEGYRENAFNQPGGNQKSAIQDFGDLPHLEQAESIAEAAAYIARLTRQVPPEQYGNWCVLARDNKTTEEVLNGLNDIPEAQGRFTLMTDFKFFKDKGVKDLTAFLRLVANPQAELSLQRIIRTFELGLTPEEKSLLLIQAEKQQGIMLTDYVNAAARSGGEPYALLLQKLQEGKVVVFDVESTGLDTTKDEIVQLSAMKVSADGTCEPFDRYIRTDRDLTESEKVHHISQAVLAARGEAASTVLNDFLKFADGCVPVGHNVTYDLAILGSELARLGLPALEYPTYYDTLDIYRRFYPGLPNYKLETLSTLYAPHISSHNAADDVAATVDLLLKAVREQLIPGADIRQKGFASLAPAFDVLADILAELRLAAKTLYPSELLALTAKRLRKAKENVLSAEKMHQLQDKTAEIEKRDLPPMDALGEFIKFISLSGSQLDALLKQHQRIPVITIHQAKGLEFDNVIIAGLREGTLPNLGALAKRYYGFGSVHGNPMDEEKRIFYVALTRARRNLYLLWWRDESQVPKQYCDVNAPSEFLELLSADSVDGLGENQ